MVLHQSRLSCPSFHSSSNVQDVTPLIPRLHLPLELGGALANLDVQLIQIPQKYTPTRVIPPVYSIIEGREDLTVLGECGFLLLFGADYFCGALGIPTGTTILGETLTHDSSTSKTHFYLIPI